MKATACLDAVGGSEDPPRYLVRLWVPAGGRFEGWKTSDWWLTDADSVEEVIGWAREHAAGSPAEVFADTGDGTLLQLWGAEPEDASTAVTMTLWRDDEQDQATG